jgi:hypothetical protein
MDGDAFKRTVSVPAPALLALLLAAPLLPAQADVSGFTPGEGTRGTQLELTGEGFGEKRPRAWLEPLDGGKSRRLRVLGWTDTGASLLVKAAKLPAGPYRVVIDPKGKDALPVASTGTFEVRLPRIDRFEPSWIADDVLVELHGEHFGSLRKPRVRLGGKPARVMEWSDERLVVKRRKKIVGDADVSVKTAAGAADGPCPLYIHGEACAAVEDGVSSQLPCPLLAPSAVFVEVDKWPQWAVAPQLVTEILPAAEDGSSGPRLSVRLGGLMDPSGYPAAMWLEFALEAEDDLTPIDQADLVLARYAVFDDSGTRTWQGDGTSLDDLTAKWSSKHCFSYAQVRADLRAVKNESPEIIRIDALLRLDGMALVKP